jgi:hypothetical protein
MNHMYIPGKGLKIPTIAQVMKGTCEFQRYQDGKLWYATEWKAPPDKFPEHLNPESWEVKETWWFEFPICVDDPAATGEFGYEMKAVQLMRWIRQHIEYLHAARKSECQHLVRLDSLPGQCATCGELLGESHSP